jgi:hypothetical protein
MLGAGAVVESHPAFPRTRRMILGAVLKCFLTMDGNKSSKWRSEALFRQFSCWIRGGVVSLFGSVRLGLIASTSRSCKTGEAGAQLQNLCTNEY